MIISFVVAASANHAIGKNNSLLWHLPNDMRFFKNTTWAMPVVMGRKTFESMNNQPLNGRTNIIITSKNDLQAATGSIHLADSPQQAVELAQHTDCKELFVIGGGEIYKAFMPMADKIYLTRVHAELDGDTFFPELSPGEWEMVSSLDAPADEKHAYPYSFQLWRRRQSTA